MCKKLLGYEGNCQLVNDQIFWGIRGESGGIQSERVERRAELYPERNTHGRLCSK